MPGRNEPKAVTKIVKIRTKQVVQANTEDVQKLTTGKGALFCTVEAAEKKGWLKAGPEKKTKEEPTEDLEETSGTVELEDLIEDIVDPNDK